MKKKNYTHKKEEAPLSGVIFCAECGEELNMFGISNVNVEQVKERYRNCKAKGKFKGDKCAMLFIASDEENINVEDEEV
ncbi:MAG: hypothetical protein GYA14_15730 [Ignavibacteria bacterium]|nr:hypothetical protein [Ignavibacteria bacterium]